MGRPKANHTLGFIRERNRGYQMAAIQRRRAAGLCLTCGANSPSVRATDIICLDCWFKHIAKLSTGTKKNGEMVRQIFEDQKGSCAYTGEKLIPGQTASLDHKLPVSRGGLSNPSNLQWTTRRLNTVKGDMTHDEFVSFCILVSKRFVQPSGVNAGDLIPCVA